MFSTKRPGVKTKTALQDVLASDKRAEMPNMPFVKTKVRPTFSCASCAENNHFE